MHRIAFTTTFGNTVAECATAHRVTRHGPDALDAAIRAGIGAHCRDIDIAYYQIGTIDNHMRPICEHVENGSNQHHCTKTPTKLDEYALKDVRALVDRCMSKLGDIVERYEGRVERVIGELREKFDWVICDSPAGIERGPTLAMRFADAAIIVTNPEVSSVRDSDRIIGLLDAKTEKAERGERIDKHLLIARYDTARVARGEMLGIDDVLEILSIPLLGIIPESEQVLRASNLGTPITISDPTSGAARAYFDAARRLIGEEVEMTIPSGKSSFLDKLFGRRAA